MLVAVEGDEAVRKGPDVGKVRVEDVGAVEVDFNPGFRVGVAADVAADGIALFENQDFPSFLGKATGEGAAPDSGSGDDGVGFMCGYRLILS